MIHSASSRKLSSSSSSPPVTPLSPSAPVRSRWEKTGARVVRVSERDKVSQFTNGMKTSYLLVKTRLGGLRKRVPPANSCVSFPVGEADAPFNWSVRNQTRNFHRGENMERSPFRRWRPFLRPIVHALAPRAPRVLWEQIAYVNLLR